MANVQRTPPQKPKTPQNLPAHQTMTQSEPDINLAIQMSENVNTSRNKRPRHNNSPQTGQVSAVNSGFNLRDLQDTLAEWKTDQDTCISKMLGEQTALITSLITEIKDIKTQNAQIKKSNTEICNSNAEIVQSISFMNNKFEEMKKEIEELKKERQEQRIYIESLERKINDLQQKTRSSSVEIRNIPQNESETSSSLIQTVCSIGKVVGVHIPPSDFRDIYRLPGKPNNSATPRPIIAEFTTVQTKQKVISSVQSFNKTKKSRDDKMNTEIIGIAGKRQPVYITDKLSPSTKKLFFIAREFAKKNNFKFCWVSNGNIFLRKQVGEKQILVNNEKCLNDILPIL
ncbi:unnamed protein product, partial [Brenthis ino]